MKTAGTYGIWLSGASTWAGDGSESRDKISNFSGFNTSDTE